MITTPTDVRTIQPWTRAQAMRIAATEYEQFIALLRDLDDVDWKRETECAGWDVHAMTSHVLGMAEWLTSFKEFGHAIRAGRKGPGTFVDALSAVQVADRADCSPSELIERFEREAPRAVKTRSRVPGLMRRMKIKYENAAGDVEMWPLSYLHDVILTRDVWMHRLDISRAVDRPILCTADHDGSLVADLVRDWANRHGQPFHLVLEGEAGGTFVTGDEGEHVGPLAAIEFCRILSGRGSGSGLLTTEVPF